MCWWAKTTKHLLSASGENFEAEDHETLADIYLVDDENIVISGELMEGLNEDLENFWEDLAKEDVL